MALRHVPRFNIGDDVVWRGEVWRLYQGVDSPKWKLTSHGGCEVAHRSEFRKVRTPANYWHSFRSMYRFYRGYWFDIWVREWRLPSDTPIAVKR